jgi:hypothetical protein
MKFERAPILEKMAQFQPVAEEAKGPMTLAQRPSGTFIQPRFIFSCKCPSLLV